LNQLKNADIAIYFAFCYSSDYFMNLVNSLSHIYVVKLDDDYYELVLS